MAGRAVLREGGDASKGSNAKLFVVILAWKVHNIDLKSGLDIEEPTELEFGACTVTCGIGFREVLLTKGCPLSEAKCIVRVEECRGPADCGWGIPIPEGSACVKMLCISVPPENRFTYVWKIFVADEAVHIVPHDSAVMEACRDTHSATFQCETQENGTVIASVKYRVCAATASKTSHGDFSQHELAGVVWLLLKKKTNVPLIILLVTGIIVGIGVIFVVIFLIFCWFGAKSPQGLKFKQGNEYRRMVDKSSQYDME
ncbi:PREDICTED: sperm acrosome membrane-associated protein 1 [Chaetura pelagica]|uniref:sperm acrosome membrane-associated protein 1 n=1 Tax=Chaetura pelagica TaxID=8897 RepID=UPI0005235A23|nr:PREDICTED: sperm acrosome membrane-associated protein 1 [Chaetura pelagica]